MSRYDFELHLTRIKNYLICLRYLIQSTMVGLSIRLSFAARANTSFKAIEAKTVDLIFIYQQQITESGD